MKIQIPEEYQQKVESYDEFGLAPEASSGVSSFVNQVYGLMCAALLVTAGSAWWAVRTLSPEQIMTWMWPAMIAELIVVFVLNFLAHRMSKILAELALVGYAALNGFTLSILFLAYTKESLAGAFAVTGGLFGVMSIYGTLTRRDLTTMGSFCIMGLFGLILAGLVNLFLGSDGLSFVTSVIGVIIFTGLVAYDSQQIRRFGAADSGQGSLAVLAALGLYLDFINLFLYVVRLTGKRR